MGGAPNSKHGVKYNLSLLLSKPDLGHNRYAAVKENAFYLVIIWKTFV